MARTVPARPIAAWIALAVGIATAGASEKSWNGRISDSMCGASHPMAKDDSGKATSDGDCVRSCVKDGSSYVFVVEGKVYQIENQTFPKLGENAGRDVTITGTMTKDAIKVSKLALRK